MTRTSECINNKKGIHGYREQTNRPVVTSIGNKLVVTNGEGGGRG